MRLPDHILRNLWVSAWYTFAIGIVLLATVFSAIRFLLPYASEYNAELSAEISRQLGQPVAIGALEAEWSGWTPALILNDINLLNAQTGDIVFQLEKARLGLDMMASLATLQPVFSRITLVGVDLELMRDKDRKISLSGLQRNINQRDKNDKAMNLDALLGWVMSQGWIQLEDSDITWRDLATLDRTLHFTSVNMSLRNAAQRHLLDASVQLPDSEQSTLNVHVDMRGDPFNKEGRETLAYIEGTQLGVRRLLGKQLVGHIETDVEQADFRLWGKWKAGEIQRIAGDFAVDGVTLQARTPAPAEPVLRAMPAEQDAQQQNMPVVFSRLASRFAWEASANGWQLEGDEVIVQSVGGSARPVRLSARYAATQDQLPEIVFKASHLQLDNFTPLVRLAKFSDARLLDAVQTLAPHGSISMADLHWQGLDNFRFYAHLQGVGMNNWKQIPAAKQVVGEVWLHNRLGQMRLDSAALELDYPRFFRNPIAVDNVSGELSWGLADKYWYLGGRNMTLNNQDVSARGSVDLLGEKGRRRPFAAIFARFSDGDGSQLSHYLPANIMKPKAVKWLDEGIVSGTAVSGDLVLHGDLMKFPFRTGDGRFEVNVKVRDGVLNYRQGWPMIHDIEADVQFLNRGMNITAHAGRIFSNKISRGTANIADFKRKPLQVKLEGEATGSTQDKLDFLATAPELAKIFSQPTENMHTTGNSEVKLALNVTMGVKEATRYRGELSVADNALTIAPVGEVLSQVSGNLKFTHDSLQAEGMQARLLGQPATIVVTTEEAFQERNIYLRTQGGYQAAQVAARLVPGIEQYFTGEGQWDVALMIPIRSGDSTQAPATFRAFSDLKGVTLSLPAPMEKSAAEVRNLEMRLEFPRGADSRLRLAYHDKLDSVFQLGGVNKVPVTRGEIRFNQGRAVVPQDQGLRIIGELDRFSLDDWRQVWLGREVTAKRGDGKAVPVNLSLLNDVRIRVKEFTAYGIPLNELQLQLTAAPQAWEIDLRSREANGQINVPKNLQNFPVVASLEKWHVVKFTPGSGKKAVDPRDLPAMQVTVDDFRYADRQFGKLIFKTRRQAKGLLLDEMQLNPESTTINLQGRWYANDANQSTAVSMRLESQNIEKTLTSLGYVGGITEGKGSAELEMSWPSSLLDVDVAKMQGQLSMDLSDGFLVDVDPGAGRMFGLLSLQMLPRRLSLDFSDVFKKGFGFDQIAGSFTIADGHARTDDFYMDGPPARVDVVGRVGLVEEDYDQLITVTPKISGALPVIGALAVTPQVGAAILFAQKILNIKFDKVTQIRYSITGSWQEPVIKKLKKQSKQPQEN